jgi:hypothetical protein
MSNAKSRATTIHAQGEERDHAGGAIMHGQPGGVAYGDGQDRNHAAAIAPFGRAVERNERSECGKALLNRIN